MLGCRLSIPVCFPSISERRFVVDSSISDVSSLPDGCRSLPSDVKPVRFEYSPAFAGILQHVKAALAITTYQAGKLAVVGSHDDELQFSFHNLQQAMGIAVAPDAVALGSRREIHLLKPAHDVAPGIGPVGTYDSAWLTRHSFRTGNIHGHELGWGKDGLWAVNTRFSTLCTLDQNFSFVPRWRPSFITSLDATDRCHLNGLAMHEGRPAFVTCHGDSDQPGGWREDKATGGVVIDVASSEVVARGFAMPHSPRIAHGKLWVLNSGAGQLGTIDPESGQFTVVESFPGYARGLSFHGQFAFVGLSKIRETSVFGGMPLESRRVELRCGVAVVDLATGRTVATLQFHSGVDEIFAVSVLPDCLRPCFAGPQDDDERADIWIVPRAVAAPGQSTAMPEVEAKSDETPATTVDRLVLTGDELQAEGRLIEARQAYEAALQVDPNRAAVHCNLGNLWQQLDDQNLAIESYQRAVTCDPGLVPAMQNLGYLLFNHGRTEEAEALYQQLVANDSSPMNRLLASGVLPVVYESPEHVQQCRRQMLRRLDAMIADDVTVDTTKTLIPTLFFVAYQGLNDVEIADRLARILTGPAAVSPADEPLRARSDGRLRIGFVSAYFRDHTIGRLNLGRIERLDREKFEVTVLMASSRPDSVATAFRSASDRYRVLPRDVQAARDTIADQDLDVLIFADVGMDALTTTLAWSRMAPVQCVTWGHPDTTGSPHIDYFLSSELLETADADNHFTEQLVRLPLLATYFERPDTQSSNDRSQSREQRKAVAADFGLSKDTHHYVCPQTLFKFHPDFDEILAGILNADPRAEIVLLEGRVPEWTARLNCRFERTLPGGCQRVTFLPAMPREEFLKLLACADVVIDPPHFGGGHTSYETFAVGTPLVTLPGDFLRSRITQALYRRMEIDDLIAASPEEFIELAVRLGTREEARHVSSKRINDANSILFENRDEVGCLEDWLWSLTQPVDNSKAPQIGIDEYVAQ